MAYILEMMANSAVPEHRNEASGKKQKVRVQYRRREPDVKEHS
jgi:hypothetical protein